MVEIDVAAGCRRKNGHELLAAFACRGINDSSAGRFAQEVDQQLIALLLTSRLLNFKMQIRPRESGDERFRLAELKLSADVLADVGRGGGRESDRLGVIELPPQSAQPRVIGTEIVAPFANAVRFIDRQKLKLRLAKLLEEQRAAQSLGGDIDQVVAPRGHVLDPLVG